MLFACYRRCILSVFALFRRASDGADGSSGHGFNWTLNATSLASIFAFLNIYGKHTFRGFGSRRRKSAGVCCGLWSGERNRVWAHTEQSAQIRIQRCSLACSASEIVDPCKLAPAGYRAGMCTFKSSNWCRFDYLVLQVPSLPLSTEIVYCFWVGMPPSTQNHVLEIVAKCLSVDTIVVFLDKNWRRPERGCQFILTYSNIPVLHPILLQISKSWLGDRQW